MRRLIALIVFLACAAPAQAAAPDVVIGPNLWVWSVNDSGQVLVNEIAGGNFAGARRYNPGGALEALQPLPGANVDFGYDIGRDGTVVGQSSWQTDPAGYWSRATSWAGGGTAPHNLGAINVPEHQGTSVARAISPNGTIGGASSYCRGGTCAGANVAAIGDPFRNAGPINDDINEHGDLLDVNDAGVGVGDQAIYENNVRTGLTFNPRRIFTDGTIVGDGFGGGGPRIRHPDGTVDTSAGGCGGIVTDANEAGEILGTDFRDQVIWHDGACYKLQDVSGDLLAGYRFVSQGASSAKPSINELGQVATMAMAPGSSTQVAVFFTPVYPVTPGRSFEITGDVTDTAGAPVAGVRVRVLRASGEEVSPPTPVVTGADGRYTWTLTPGAYRVTAMPEGSYDVTPVEYCAITAFSCDLTLDRNREVDFTVRPAGPGEPSPPSPSPSPLPTPSPTPSPPTVSVAKAKAAKDGSVTLTVRAPGAGRLSAVAKVKNRTVATAKRTTKAAGTVKLKLKPSRKRLKRGKLKAKVTVTFTAAAGGAPVTTKRTVTFKRR